MKTTDLNDVIDQMPSLLDLPLPGQVTRVLERTSGDDCIFNDEDGIRAIGIVKPKIKTRQCTKFEEELVDNWKYTSKKMVRCIQHVPVFNRCVLVYESGQILITTDKENYDV